MASTDRVIELARELSDAFETRYRDDTRNETAYKTLHEGSPEWMTDVCRAVHDAAAMLPDDTRYVFIEDAADAIAEEPTDPDCDAEEHDWSETRDGMSEPDIYTNDLTRWLASRVDRFAYCDDALDEYGSGSLAHLEGGPTLALIRLGQSAEKAEVFDQVLAALIAHADSEPAALRGEYGGDDVETTARVDEQQGGEA